MNDLHRELFPPLPYHDWTRNEQLLYVLRGALAIAERTGRQERAWVSISELCNPAFCLHTVAQAAMALKRDGHNIVQEFRPRDDDPTRKISKWRIYETAQSTLGL